MVEGGPPEPGERIAFHMEHKQEMPNAAFTHRAELNPNNIITAEDLQFEPVQEKVYPQIEQILSC